MHLDYRENVHDDIRVFMKGTNILLNKAFLGVSLYLITAMINIVQDFTITVEKN